MRAYCTGFLVALVCSTAALTPHGGAAQRAATSSAAGSASHAVGFAADIDAFLERDETAPPQKHAILFVGSSIFRRWTTLTEQMAPLPVLNRAFGGSRTWEVLAYMDKIVLPYEPDALRLDQPFAGQARALERGGRR
jgi:hypothetical protein